MIISKTDEMLKQSKLFRGGEEDCLVMQKLQYQAILQGVDNGFTSGYFDIWVLSEGDDKCVMCYYFETFKDVEKDEYSFATGDVCDLVDFLNEKLSMGKFDNALSVEDVQKIDFYKNAYRVYSFATESRDRGFLGEIYFDEKGCTVYFEKVEYSFDDLDKMESFVKEKIKSV